MIGAVGFTVLTIAVGAYAYTSHAVYSMVPLAVKRSFVAAFSLLALASLVWTSTFFVDEISISALVFMSDAILILATGCMLGVLLDLSRPRYFIIAAVIAAGLLTLRAYAVPSSAYIDDGLLYFNLPQLVAYAIGFLFLVIWLPATIKVAYQALRSPKSLSLRGPVSFLLISTVLMTSFFLSAQRPIMVIITFVSIIILFLALTGVNLALEYVQQSPRKKGAHHGRTK